MFFMLIPSCDYSFKLLPCPLKLSCWAAVSNGSRNDLSQILLIVSNQTMCKIFSSIETKATYRIFTVNKLYIVCDEYAQ